MFIEMIKCHGTGNDFILIDEIAYNYNFTEEDRKNIAIKLCDRKKAIGGDGILFVQKSEDCSGKMQIINSDGSEAEMCGNGLRCVGKYLLETTGEDKILVETMKAVYAVEKVQDIYKGVFTDEITIDSIDFNVSSLPLVYEKENLFFEKLTELSDIREFTAISITNPHLVSFVEEIEKEELKTVGIKANDTRDLLPKGVNVNYVKEIDEDSIYVKTYERGVGLTKSCGTGMVSSSIATLLKHGISAKTYNVYNDGGMIQCKVTKNEDGIFRVMMRGNATFIYKSTISIERNFNYSEGEREYFTKENQCYEEFLAYTKNIINK